MLAPRPVRVLPLLGATGAPHQSLAAAALARGFAELGLEVLVADQSPGGVAQEFGLRARYELSHVIDGHKDWAQVLMSGAPGISLLPATRGLARMADAAAADALVAALAALPARPDLVILNLARAEAAQWLVDDAADWLVLFSCRPSGLVPAYRAVKSLAHVARPGALRTLACHAADEPRARDAFGVLASAGARFLGLDMQYTGLLPELDTRRGAGAASLRALAARAEGWRLAGHAPQSGVADRTPNCATDHPSARRAATLWS
jgi:flagellar biosynthesis protein FlhG